MAPALIEDHAIASNGKTKTPNFAKTAGEEIGFASPPKLDFKNQFEEREYVKGRLAGAYRIFGHYGLNEGLAGPYHYQTRFMDHS